MDENISIPIILVALFVLWLNNSGRGADLVNIIKGLPLGSAGTAVVGSQQPIVVGGTAQSAGSSASGINSTVSSIASAIPGLANSLGNLFGQ